MNKHKIPNLAKIKEFFHFDIHSTESIIAFISIAVTFLYNEYINKNPDAIINQVMEGFLTVVVLWVILSYIIKLFRLLFKIDIKKATSPTK